MTYFPDCKSRSHVRDTRLYEPRKNRFDFAARIRFGDCGCATFVPSSCSFASQIMWLLRSLCEIWNYCLAGRQESTNGNTFVIVFILATQFSLIVSGLVLPLSTLRLFDLSVCLIQPLLHSSPQALGIYWLACESCIHLASLLCHSTVQVIWHSVRFILSVCSLSYTIRTR